MNIGDIVDNKYQVIEFKGQGGMGRVFKVQSIVNKEEFALKYCLETDEASIRRFKREVRILSEVDHPNVIKIIEHNLSYSPPYFVMPLAVASVEHIKSKIINNFDLTYNIFKKISFGIIALHKLDKYHRDIKPSNALIMKDRNIVVSDLGLAKMVNKDSSTHSSSNYFLGTIGYHAPEQVNAKKADIRTDIFQLGKTFYAMYTGENPELINLKLLPFGLRYIIQKTIQQDPDDRYQTVSSLLQALRSFKKSLTPELNPKDALTAKIDEMIQLLNENEYDEDICKNFINLLGSQQDDTSMFIDYFDQIPHKLLKIFSTYLKEIFKPIFELYTKKLSDYFNDNYIGFEYAETVAKKMTTIFHSTDDINFKGIAIRNTLRVAIWCNRFNAMDTFDNLLQQIQKDEEAVVIGEVLREEIDLYKKLADRIQNNQLNHIIRDVKNEALNKLNDDNKKGDEELKYFIDEL